MIDGVKPWFVLVKKRPLHPYDAVFPLLHLGDAL